MRFTHFRLTVGYDETVANIRCPECGREIILGIDAPSNSPLDANPYGPAPKLGLVRLGAATWPPLPIPPL
jgi:hypothetical protein